MVNIRCSPYNLHNLLIRDVTQIGKENQKLALQLEVMDGPKRKATNVLLPSNCYISSLQL